MCFHHFIAPHQKAYIMKSFVFLTVLGLTTLFMLYKMIPQIDSEIFGELRLTMINSSFIVKGAFYASISDYDLTIPVGYRTQLKSAPEFVKNTSSPYLKHFVLHSYLYDCPDVYSRYEADLILYNALVHNNMSQVTALKHYIYLRLFGTKYFNKGGTCLDDRD